MQRDNTINKQFEKEQSFTRIKSQSLRQSRPLSAAPTTKCPISGGVYNCAICSRLKKQCPYSLAQFPTSFCCHPIKNIINQNPIQSQITPQKICIQNYIKIPQFQQQQIIYYPVVHNRLVFHNPNPESLKKKYIEHVSNNKHIQKSSFLSSTQPQQPMTPEQLKNMTLSFLK